MDRRLKINFVPFTNFGDTCVPYMMKKMNVPFIFAHHTVENKMTMIGSIIQGSTRKNTVVWGTGLMYENDKPVNYLESDIRAVRGPRTKQRLKDLGVNVDGILEGDPALLLPRVYDPKVEKKYKLGVIPHMVDGGIVIKHIKNNPDKFPNTIIIDPNSKVSQIEKFISDVKSCEKIVSTALHGIICAHAYGIPVKWMKVSNNLMGDDIKFHDHFESLGLTIDGTSNPIPLIENEDIDIPKVDYQEKLTEITDALWNSKPWDNLPEEYYVDIDDENWISECYPEGYSNKIWTDKMWNI